MPKSPVLPVILLAALLGGEAEAGIRSDSFGHRPHMYGPPLGAVIRALLPLNDRNCDPLVTTNLLLRSEELTVSAPWAAYNAGASAAVLTAAAGASPFGTNTATRIQFPATTTSQYSAWRQTMALPNASYTASCYFKGTSSSGSLYFAVLDNVPSAAFGSMTVSYNSTTWTRASLPFTVSGGVPSIFWFGGAASISGAQPANDVLIWGCQAETGSVMTDYVPTAGTAVTASRLFVNGGTPVTWARTTTATCTKNDNTLVTVATGQPRCNSSGCQIEPAATNLLQQSQTFESATWQKLNAVVTADQTLAPDGTATADKVADNTTNGVHLIYNDTATQPGGNYTASLFMKMGTARYVALGNPGFTSYSTFDLQLGTATMAGSTISTSITALANGWFRCFVTWPTAGSSTNIVIGSTPTNATTGYAGTGSYVYAWGYQVEAGLAGTSYIPTVATAVARNADVPSFLTPRWVNGVRGCAAATLLTPFASSPLDRYVLSFTGGYGPGISFSGGQAFIFSSAAQTFLSVSNIANRPITIVGSWSGTTQTVSADGSSSSGTLGTMSGATTYLGNYNGGATWINGYLSNIKLGNTSSGCR